MLRNAKKYANGIMKKNKSGIQYHFCSGCGGLFPEVRSTLNFSFLNNPDKKVRFEGYCQDCLSKIDYENERSKVIKLSHRGERYVCRL